MSDCIFDKLKIMTDTTFDISDNLPLRPELDPQHFQRFYVIRRNGERVAFDPHRIIIAVDRAFMASEGGHGQVARRIHDFAQKIALAVIDDLKPKMQRHGAVHIEEIQDQVETELMRTGRQKVARLYVLYREQQSKQRATNPTPVRVTCADGSVQFLDQARLYTVVHEACEGLADVSFATVLAENEKAMFDRIHIDDVSRSLVMCSSHLIEKEPNYSHVAARLLLDRLRSEALPFVQFPQANATAQEMAGYYPDYFKRYLQTGVDHELLNPKLLHFDLAVLAQAIVPERDLQFSYLGLQTLYDRYFLHYRKTRFELPQAFFMRIAMGLALNESDKEQHTLSFYHALSTFSLMSSTPTLFNAGSLRSQLSSCYLTTIPDDLNGIFSGIRDNALLSKFAGGLGNDWTAVRAMGAHIKGTNGKSQGVVPFLKVANDTLVACNQCFSPDTKVFTAQGVKPIKDIEIGDLVLGQRGEYREVKQKLAYNQLDDMVALNFKHSIEPVKVTSGHPFWAIKGVPKSQSTRRLWLEKGKLNPDWVAAGDLEVGDYVAQVIPQEIIPVADFNEDDAHLYGIMLGDGHCCKRQQTVNNKTYETYEWGVSGNPSSDKHLIFVRNYLEKRGVHYWEVGKRDNYMQLHWANSSGLLRDGTTGQFVRNESSHLPFSYDDLYNENKQKRIAPRFSHLPKQHTLALLQGLIETDGGISRGKEIYFTNSSEYLIEGVRYQCLRLGAPVAGQYRERDNAHTGVRADGTEIQFNGISKVYDLRIPAIPELAQCLNCQPLSKYNWIHWRGCVFTRLKSSQKIPSLPFIFDLKVDGDPSYMTTSALAHNGGRRKGSGCAYLETWHLDIEEFLELRKSTGDERRRTHDMNTALWIPDEFMRRVHEDREWTLFSPDEVNRELVVISIVDDTGKAVDIPVDMPLTVIRQGLSAVVLAADLAEDDDTPLFTGQKAMKVRQIIQRKSKKVFHLHDIYGQQFLIIYLYYERLAAKGDIKLSKKMPAIALWRKMLTMLFETGHPWLTFKDPCNIRSPQQHVGVVHSSNLCTEITLNTSEEEIAVCNLASINLPAHTSENGLNEAKLAQTIKTALRMLDNVIDINYYSVPQAERANLRHRPVGLGLMGFQAALYQQRIPYASEQAAEFADKSMELISYYAIKSSSDLAKERGVYPSFAGSLWSQGILPLDSLKKLHHERPDYLQVNLDARLDWDSLRQQVQTHGMRNSNCMAIAPTATISNICGVTQSIEPTYQNLFIKSNLSGEFAVINHYLVNDLKALGLWDETMINDLKYFDGSVQAIARIPAELKALYATAFEIDADWLIEAASRRQKWLDQAQSLNLYIKEPSGKKLDALYKLAWMRGLKTTYYLRSVAATRVERSGVQNIHPLTAPAPVLSAKECLLDDPECEACQ